MQFKLREKPNQMGRKPSQNNNRAVTVSVIIPITPQSTFNVTPRHNTSKDMTSQHAASTHSGK